MISTTAPATAREWQVRLAGLFPGRRIFIWPDNPSPDTIAYVLAWRPPSGLFGHFPNLKAVVSLAAGLDHLKGDPTLPADAAVIRLSGLPLARQLTEYALYYLLKIHRGFDLYETQQRRAQWQSHPIVMAGRCRVGVMGLGEIGGHLATTIHNLGFDVAGWARSARDENYPTFRGDEGFAPFLARSDVVICVLPLTPETHGLLGRRAFGSMPAGACLINIGRGSIVDTGALLDALDSGHLSMAVLDVFDKEPLPADSLLWGRSDVLITPHVAGDVQPEWGAYTAAEKIRDFESRFARNVTAADITADPYG